MTTSEMTVEITKLFSIARSEISRRATSATDSAPAHAATAARNRSARLGRSRLKCVTVPAARAASSTASGWAPGPSRTSSPRGPASASSAPGHAGQPAAVAVALHAHPDLLHAAASAVAQLGDRARRRPAGRG